MAGVDVDALAVPKAYAKSGELIAVTTELAKLADVSDGITFAEHRTQVPVGTVDIVTYADAVVVAFSFRPMASS